MVSGRMARCRSLRKARASREAAIEKIFFGCRTLLNRSRAAGDARRPETATTDRREHALATARGAASVRSLPQARQAHPPARRARLPTAGSRGREASRYEALPTHSTQEATPGTQAATLGTQAASIGAQASAHERTPGWGTRRSKLRNWNTGNGSAAGMERGKTERTGTSETKRTVQAIKGEHQQRWVVTGVRGTIIRTRHAGAHCTVQRRGRIRIRIRRTAKEEPRGMAAEPGTRTEASRAALEGKKAHNSESPQPPRSAQEYPPSGAWNMVNHVHTRVLTSVTLACSPSTNGYGCDNRTHSHGVSSSLPASVIDCEFAKNLLACALGSRAIALPSMNVVRLVNVQCGPIVQCTEFCVNGITSLELATGPITTTIWTQLHIVNCYSDNVINNLRAHAVFLGTIPLCCGPIVQCTEFRVNCIISGEWAIGSIHPTIWTHLRIVNCYSDNVINNLRTHALSLGAISLGSSNSVQSCNLQCDFEFRVDGNTVDNCIRNLRVGMPLSCAMQHTGHRKMSRKAATTKGNQARAMELRAVSQALQQVEEQRQSRDGTGFGIGQAEAARSRRIEAKAAGLERGEAKQQQDREQEERIGRAAADLAKMEEVLSASGRQPDAQKEGAAAKRLQQAISGLDYFTAKQSVRMAYHLATKAADPASLQRMFRTSNADGGGIRLRITGPAAPPQQVFEQTEGVKKWAVTKEIAQDDVKDQTPQSNEGYGSLVLIFHPAPPIMAAIAKNPRVQIGGNVHEFKLMYNPSVEIDLRPTRNADGMLHAVAQVLQFAGVSEGQLEKFLEEALKHSVPMVAPGIDYVRVEGARQMGGKKVRLSPFDIGKKGMGGGPRITVGMTQQARATIAESDLSPKITIGPHPEHPVLIVPMVLERDTHTVVTHPITPKETLKALRTKIDTSNEQFEKAVQGLIELTRATERELPRSGGEEEGNQLQEALDRFSFWPEQEIVQETAHELQTLMQALKDRLLPATLAEALEGFADALTKYLTGTWVQRKRDIDVFWLMPATVGFDSFRQKIEPKTQKKDPVMWEKAIRTGLMQEPGCFEIGGVEMSIEVKQVQVMAEKTDRNEFTTRFGFAVAITNPTPLKQALMTTKGAMWPGTLNVKADLSLFDSDSQAVSKTGLAEKIMTLARSGALIFFDRSDAIETGMARTMLSDLVTPAEHSPFHITRIYVQLQVTFEDTEDLFAVLGDLRHRGQLRTVAVGKKAETAYGTADIIKTLERDARHSDWATRLPFGQDSTQIIRNMLQECLSAAIFAGAAGGLWLEGRAVVGPDRPELKLETYEAEPLGPNMADVVLGEFSFLVQIGQAQELVAAAVLTTITDENITPIGAGPYTLLLRVDEGINIDHLLTHGRGARIGLPLPPELRQYNGEMIQAIQGQLADFLCRQSAIIEGPADLEPVHWTLVQACPPYAKNITAPKLLQTLSAKSPDRSVKLTSIEWATIMRADGLELRPQARVFLLVEGSATGWIPVEELSVAHALAEPASPARAGLVRESLQALKNTGNMIESVSGVEADAWRVYVSMRRRPTMSTPPAALQAWLTPLEGPLRRILRPRAREGGQRVLRAALIIEVLQKVHTQEEDALLGAIADVQPPFYLPLSPGKQFDENEMTGDMQARQLFKTVQHPLITTPAGMAILWEEITAELEKAGSAFWPCTGGGYINVAGVSKFNGLDQSDVAAIDMTETGEADIVATLEAHQNKKQQSKVGEGEGGKASADEEMTAATTEEAAKKGTTQPEKRKQTMEELQTGDESMKEAEEETRQSKKHAETAGPAPSANVGKVDDRVGSEQHGGAATPQE